MTNHVLLEVNKMAVIKAKDSNKKDDVYKGASGGLAPEGYGLVNLIGGSNPKVDDVANRSREEDDKKFQKAEKFQKSKVQAEKHEESAAKQTETPVEAEKKPQPQPEVDANVKKNNK